MNYRIPGLLLATLLAAGCDGPMEYEDDWMDSPSVQDRSLNDPSYRLSTRPGRTVLDRTRPVIIAVHGFTASTYEWEEFRRYAETTSPVLVSLVLLGGHGRAVDEFEETTWAEWGEPILEEYRALVAQGYANISLAGASTGGALILQQLAADQFREVAPRNFFFIDPIVVPGDKNLSLIPLLKHLIGHVVTEGTEEEKAHWYINRPTAALAQLYDLIGEVRSELESGIRLPAGSRAKVYKTSGDETADPLSALLIYKGLRLSNGEAIDVQMIDSDLHVLTRLQGRSPEVVTDEARRQQRQVFDEMIQRARGALIIFGGAAS